MYALLATDGSPVNNRSGTISSFAGMSGTGDVDMTPTNDPGRLIGWLAVLVFVVGSFLAFLRIRDWYYRRGWSPDPLNEPKADGEQYPMTRFSLRRLK